MSEMIIKRSFRMPSKDLFSYRLSNRPGYTTKMITVNAPCYGLSVNVYEPTFLGKLFNISMEDKVEKAKTLILEEIESDKRWNDLCHMLKNS